MHIIQSKTLMINIKFCISDCYIVSDSFQFWYLHYKNRMVFLYKLSCIAFFDKFENHFVWESFCLGTVWEPLYCELYCLRTVLFPRTVLFENCFVCTRCVATLLVAINEIRRSSRAQKMTFFNYGMIYSTCLHLCCFMNMHINICIYIGILFVLFVLIHF